MLTTLFETRRPQMYPTLTPAQLTRLAAYGKRTRVEAGEILAQSGEREGRVLVILSGSVEILRTGLAGDERVNLHGPGSFTGEMSTLRGARSLALFHHDPVHGDDAMDRIGREAAELGARMGVPEVTVARDQMQINLNAHAAPPPDAGTR